MAILKAKDIAKMKKEDIDKKLDELRFELAKGSVVANKTNAKTKEIKKTIARLITIKKITGSLGREVKN